MGGGFPDRSGRMERREVSQVSNPYQCPYQVPSVRTFPTGANRDTDAGKLDYEGFLSPLVLQRFAEYMHKNRTLADGSLRDSDNWQRGIPTDAYMKSGFRHFFDWWRAHRGWRAYAPDELQDALCALMFNTMGYLHEHLKAQRSHASTPKWIPNPAEFSEVPGEERLVTMRAHDDLHTDYDARPHPHTTQTFVEWSGGHGEGAL